MTKKATPALPVSRTILALLLGVTPSRISQLVDEGMPALKTGRQGRRSEFDAIACARWVRSRAAAGSGDAKLRDERLRLQNRKLQIELQKRTGELVPAAGVGERWTRMVTAARERLLSLPATAVQRGLVAASAEDALIELVHEALTELSERRAPEDAAA